MITLGTMRHAALAAILVAILPVRAAISETRQPVDAARLLDTVLGPAEAPVESAPLPTAVTVTPATEKLLVGDTLTLTATSDDPLDTFTWSTSDALVATVDPAGEVSAIALGTATITATGSNSGLTDTTVVEVVTAIIEIAPASATVLVGNTVTLSATSTDSTDTFTWSSSDTGIASVDSASGVVTGVSGGTASITASGSNSGETDTSTVSVTSPTITLGLGECFITALLEGTPFAFTLPRLRVIRDDALLESAFGCAFVDAYYRASPAATRILRRLKSGHD